MCVPGGEISEEEEDMRAWKRIEEARQILIISMKSNALLPAEAHNRKHWLANGQGCDKGSVTASSQCVLQLTVGLLNRMRLVGTVTT
ncbi:hypothetical protein NQZ68_028404 [Dissostichus eleginoides]|nr:hypothetical protein NQZ68_028404 [Dissostichus eleginoides]